MYLSLSPGNDLLRFAGVAAPVLLAWFVLPTHAALSQQSADLDLIVWFGEEKVPPNTEDLKPHRHFIFNVCDWHLRPGPPAHQGSVICSAYPGEPEEVTISGSMLNQAGSRRAKIVVVSRANWVRAPRVPLEVKIKDGSESKIISDSIGYENDYRYSYTYRFGSDVPEELTVRVSAGELEESGQKEADCESKGMLVLANEERIAASTLDGDTVKTITDKPRNARGLAVAEESNYVFWSETSKSGTTASLYRTRIDGSDWKTIAEKDVAAGGGVGDAVVGPEARVVYWIAGNTIQESAVSGGYTNEVMGEERLNLSPPIDTREDQIYFSGNTSTPDGNIREPYEVGGYKSGINVTRESFETVRNSLELSPSPDVFEVGNKGEYVYWSEDGHLKRSTMDGSSTRALYRGDGSIGDLTITSGGKCIYWLEVAAQENSVSLQRIDLESEEVTEVRKTSGALSSPYRLQIEYIGAHRLARAGANRSEAEGRPSEVERRPSNESSYDQNLNLDIVKGFGLSTILSGHAMANFPSTPSLEDPTNRPTFPKKKKGVLGKLKRLYNDILGRNRLSTYDDAFWGRPGGLLPTARKLGPALRPIFSGMSETSISPDKIRRFGRRVRGAGGALAFMGAAVSASEIVQACDQRPGPRDCRETVFREAGIWTSGLLGGAAAGLVVSAGPISLGALATAGVIGFSGGVASTLLGGDTGDVIQGAFEFAGLAAPVEGVARGTVDAGTDVWNGLTSTVNDVL